MLFLHPGVLDQVTQTKSTVFGKVSIIIAKILIYPAVVSENIYAFTEDRNAIYSM